MRLPGEWKKSGRGPLGRVTSGVGTPGRPYSALDSSVLLPLQPDASLVEEGQVLGSTSSLLDPEPGSQAGHQRFEEDGLTNDRRGDLPCGEREVVDTAEWLGGWTAEELSVLYEEFQTGPDFAQRPWQVIGTFLSFLCLAIRGFPLLILLCTSCVFSSCSWRALLRAKVLAPFYTLCLSCQKLTGLLGICPLGLLVY